MARFSYSRVDCFNQCKRKYKYRYVDGLSTIPDADPDNALYLGSALHLGIEQTVEAGIEEYLSHYYSLNDALITNCMVLEHWIPEVKRVLPGGGQHELKLQTDEFIGYIDYVCGDTLFDFKYSNAVDRYTKSKQLSIYKYFYEKLTGNTINHLKYVFIPKAKLRQKRTESIQQFRQRLMDTIEQQSINIVEVEYDEDGVTRFLDECEQIETVTDYPAEPNDWCQKYCEFYDLCQNGSDWRIMDLPKNERRKKTKETLTELPSMYIYGESYVGKSTFLDSLDDVIVLNTDGNVDSYTSPCVPIAKTVKMNGRMRVEKSAWENFLEVVSALEEHSQNYKYVALDLIEDLREYCRTYIQKKLKIDHESDSAYSKGWDMVTLEFNQAIKRIKAAGYQVIFVSKETAKEITEKSGAKYTKFAPNIQEKTANTLAGMVSLTARFYFADDGSRKIHLSGNPHVYGGGRFNFKVDNCEMTKDALLKVMNDAEVD